MSKFVFVGPIASLLLLAGCASPGAVVGSIFTLGLGAAIPGHSIRQTYYVGVVDPLEQVPPSLYRITVRGEASIVSNVRLESGWVHSSVVDSLNTRIERDDAGRIVFSKAEDDGSAIASGRGLWMFGPEGFRRAPRDHRLAIVMSADPSEFFAAMNETLGQLTTAQKFDDAAAAKQDARLCALLDVIETEQAMLATGSATESGR